VFLSSTDGIMTMAKKQPSTTAIQAVKDIALPLYIGGEDSNVYVVNGTYLNGWIDEMRITKGVARYGGDFTPPTAAFPDA